MSTSKTIKSALISVFNKDGLAPIVQKLNELNVTIYSTGGTEKFIKELLLKEDQGAKLRDIEDKLSSPFITFQKDKKNKSNLTIAFIDFF